MISQRKEWRRRSGKKEKEKDENEEKKNKKERKGRNGIERPLMLWHFHCRVQVIRITKWKSKIILRESNLSTVFRQL